MSSIVFGIGSLVVGKIDVFVVFMEFIFGWEGCKLIE